MPILEFNRLAQKLKMKLCPQCDQQDSQLQPMTTQKGKVKMKTKLYDTCSLLMRADNLFELEEKLAISSITLGELEHIKTAANKDPDVKFAARKLLHDLDQHYGEYEIIQYSESYNEPIIQKHLELNNDTRIIACGLHYAEQNPSDDFVFVTNDLSCKHIAHMFFDTVESVIEDDFDYDGFKEVYLNTDEMSNFYSNLDKNTFDLLVNEYLIVHDAESREIVDRLCWTGEGYRHLNYETFNSKLFGNIKPISGDVYQAMAADSFVNNKITMVKGPAGSGKTYLSLGYLIHKLEKGKIDKIIIFCNTVATKNSAKLGFYPGTRDEKLLDSQIGNLLISKFGGRYIVEEMINDEKLVLLPLADIRGYDTSGMRAGIYISEAQNMDVGLMKLTLQRIGEDSICIIDGDAKTQVDLAEFSGSSNGMRRASKVYRGEDVYGEVTLKKIHRSKIAQIAERM